VRGLHLLAPQSLIVPVLTVSMLLAQAAVPGAQAPLQQFEVASVKKASPLAGNEAKIALVIRPAPVVEGERLRARACSILSLLAFAYGVTSSHVLGPGWLEEEQFDIMAKLPDGASRNDAPQMMRALLVERFGLEAHTLEKNVSIYALRAKSQSAQLPDADPSAPARPGCKTGACGGYRCEKITMKRLAQHMSAASWQRMAGLDGLPVVDLTGLTGTYSFDLPVAWVASFSPRVEMAEECRVPGNSVFKALNTLGLSLEREKQPQQFVAVDKISRAPTPN